MPKYPGRIISATPPTVNALAASGIWTLEEALKYKQAGTWPTQLTADPNFNQTVLLLHGDGTNGAQNNTFLDSSSNNFTITRNGNTTQGTFSPFSLAAGEWGNFFDGTGDRLTAPANAAFQPGTGDFSLEAFFYSQTTAVAGLCGTNYTGASPNTYIIITLNRDSNGNNTAGAISAGVSDAAGNSVATSSAVFSNNTWNHVVFCRTGSTLSLFLNGSRVVTTTNTTNITPNIQFEVGDTSALTRPFAGYISNVRFIKGSHPYNATQTTYTVPTTPLTAITNTSLLTCQSNRFVDNSTNAFAITRNGDVRVTPFSPFAPTAAYSAGTNGGSGYFDGSGDYLAIADNAAFTMGSGDFTIEYWTYFLGGADLRVYGQFASSLSLSTISFFGGSSAGNKVLNGVYSGTTGYTCTSSADMPTNQWVHIAFVRDGNTLRQYINGVQDGTSNVTGVSINDSSTQLSIGRPGEYAAQYWNGYISNFRIVKGTCVYPSGTAFTPPTAPLTAITNTSLLCNFTNAGIIDNTGKNNLETVGNAQIDTTTKKYGTGSLEFDGTGDWLLMPNNPDQQLGTGNFTIEFWVYLATGDTGSARGLVAKGTSTTGWLVSLDSSQKVVFTFTTSTITSSGAITTNAWNYIAVVREGTGSNQTKIYINAINDGTGTVSTDFNQTSVMYVGANRTGGDAMKGFIDDLRITKGIARTIIAPGSAFPDS